MTSGTQFGRYVELNFFNLITKQKITIASPFKIEFEYTKAFDASESSSTGTITIYGLTKETMLSLGDRFTTEVECKVGYINEPENIKVLFYALVTGTSPRISENKIDINVSCNFQNLHLTKKESINVKNARLVDILTFLDTKWKHGFAFLLNQSIPKEKQDQFAAFFYGAMISNWSFSGTLQQYIEKLKTRFGLILTLDNVEKNKFNVTITQQGVENFLNESASFKQNLNQVYNTSIEPSINLQAQSSPYFKPIIESPISDTQAVVLSYKTGLLETPYPENRTVSVDYNYTVGNTEDIVKRKIPQPLKDKKTGEVKLDDEGNVKMSKPPKQMTINRRFLSAKALINPSITPQSQVRIESADESINTLYRVRTVKFKGDTWDGEWMMEMELEDTSDFTFKRLEKGDRGLLNEKDFNYEGEPEGVN